MHLELSDDDRFAADVTIPEIREKDYNLSLERYLLPPAVMAVEAFLAEKQVRPLEDVVEMIRPLSMGNEDDGEFMIREAVPADIGNDDLLTEPEKRDPDRASTTPKSPKSAPDARRPPPLD